MEHASPEEAWNECLQFIQDNINRQSYKTWFEPLSAVGLEEEAGKLRLTIQLPSRFYYEWLEEHYYTLLRKAVKKVLGRDGQLYYDIVIEKDDPDEGYGGASVQLPARSEPQEPPASSTSGSSISAPADEGQEVTWENSSDGGEPLAHPFAIPGIQDTPRQIDSQLNPGYTFDRFIEGDCNRLARSAAWAIAQQPGATSFNPFLIYGGVGLGKTHLIQAVGNHAELHGKADRVLYVSSERFTTEFVQSIQNNRVSEFSLFYRQIDLLIVDDIQFFGGKEKTQEEFFHIFNALHQSGKQIILSADRPPKDIEGIEERLLSRFQWGLSSDVQAPGLETRIAILQRKAEDDGIDLPPDVIEFIAHNIKRNIRELEGSLIRLLAHATLHQCEIDLQLAKNVLKDLIQEPRVNLSIEEIQRIVCDYYGIDEDRVRARTRKREVVRARQVAMYFSKEFTSHSLKTIGLHFGGRDHSTVIHANKTVDDQIETDPSFRDEVKEIRHQLDIHSRS